MSSDSLLGPPKATPAILVAQNLDARRWTDFLARHGRPFIYHHPAWDRVFAVYGLQICRLAAIRDDQIVGVLPLVYQRSWLFGRRLISLPWFDAVGILADDEEAREALLAEARELATRWGCETVELRQLEPVASWTIARQDKILMRLRLENTPEALWNRFNAKVRNQIRKGQKLGLTTQTGGTELVRALYDVYSVNMRDLGSPSHSERFFGQVLESFPGEARVHVVRLESQAVGTALTLANGNCLEVPWASSVKHYNSYCVNHILYWHILEQACRQGFEWFHFGRSTKDSGPFRFKKQWGAEERPLSWYTFAQLPEVDRPANVPGIETRYRRASWAWQHLPLFIARRLGPHLISRLP